MLSAFVFAQEWLDMGLNNTVRNVIGIDTVRRGCRRCQRGRIMDARDIEESSVGGRIGDIGGSEDMINSANHVSSST